MRRRKVVSEINVVPYIDVMLVLLVIFMVAAPLMIQGVNVNLPEVRSNQLSISNLEPIIISVKEDGSYFLETEATKGEKINLQDLSRITQMISSKSQNRQVVIRGDAKVPYLAVMELMSELQNIGIADVGLITQPPRK